LKKGISAAQMIEEAVLAAEKDLVAFTHKPILAALKATPDGVHVRAFDGVEYKGVNLARPKKVAVVMKETNCIIYHMPSGEYRLVSIAHRTALMLQKECLAGKLQQDVYLYTC
jgi:ribosomal protein L2